MHLIQHLMRVFFDLLYHPLAFTYDLVSATVSLGRWQAWVMAVLPFIEGSRVLELGYGPGYLQEALQSRALVALGLDESRQMTSLAKRRLRSGGLTRLNLTRGLAAQLPYPNEAFNTVVSTFPSEYIFDLESLTEARRVLANGGRLIVLPVAWHIGRGLLEKFMGWVFHITGESPGPVGTISQRLRVTFEKAGFQVDIQKLEVKSSLLLVFIAVKSS